MVLVARIRSRAALRLRAFSLARRLTSSSLRGSAIVIGRPSGSPWSGIARATAPDQVREKPGERDGGRRPRGRARRPRWWPRTATDERVGERARREPPLDLGVGRGPRDGGRRGGRRPPTFAIAPSARGCRRQHAGRGARHREQPPELAVEEARREGPRELRGGSRWPGSRRRRRSRPRPRGGPGASVAPPRHAKTATTRSANPDRGRDVRDTGPQGALDAVVRRPRAAVVVAVAPAVRVGGAGPGRRVTARRRRRPIAGRNEGMAVVLVRTIPSGRGSE